jgi:hypothetical protein
MTHTARARSRAAPGWEREWRDVDARDRAEALRAPARRSGTGAVVGLGVVAVVAAALAAVLPLSPGYSASDTAAQVVAATLAGIAAVGVVGLAARAATRVNPLLYGVALLSAGAAAIHFAVVKGHLEEYPLFGVLFAVAAVAQVCWALLAVIRPARPLLLLGAAGNLGIAAMWAVDRIWGLPIGPEHWKPESVGFADTAASAFEVLIALGCLALIAGARARPHRRAALALTLAVGTLTVLSLLSVLGVGSTVITPSA